MHWRSIWDSFFWGVFSFQPFKGWHVVVLSDFGQLRMWSSLTQRKVPSECFCFDIFSGVPDENTKRFLRQTEDISFRIDAVDLVFCHCCLQTGQPVPSHDLIVYIWFQDSETSSWRMGTNSSNRTGMSWKMAFLIEWSQFFGKTPNYKISGL